VTFERVSVFVMAVAGVFVKMPVHVHPLVLVLAIETVRVEHENDTFDSPSVAPFSRYALSNPLSAVQHSAF
jgi:hypothetical protein